ncbi:G2/mitotic-specific cyclin [Rhizina undulata]
MQSRRATRQRSAATSHENNDENRVAATTRLTRAKAAALSTSDSTTTGGALAAKQSNVNLTAAVNSRKRPALGDVSNVHKLDAGDDKKAGGKKAVSKIAVSSKITTTAGVTKSRATATTRATVKNAATAPAAEVKKASNGVAAGRKKRSATSNASSRPKKAEAAPAVEKPAKSTMSAVEINNIKDEADHGHVAKKQRVKEPVAPIQDWDDLDEEDADDPLMVSEYVNEIFDYLRELEPATQPNPDYMDHQEDLQWKMRGILVDWLIEVHTRFRLLPETLFLAVNIVDRFLSNKVVLLDKLQLVGVTAMFIAAKYEEVFSPHVQYFRHVADDGFTEEEILRAERFVLSTLDYNLSYPNPMNFLRRISKADSYDFQTRTVAKYLMEISLLDHRFMEFMPSHVAAAAMYLSRMMLERGPWDANLVHYSDYTEKQILPVFRLMIDYLVRPVKHEAFYKKYASKKFMKASIHARQWAKRYAESHGVSLDIQDEDNR